MVVNCVGCVGTPYAERAPLPKKPGQETAELLIQQRLSELTGWPIPRPWQMPEVAWIEALNCARGTGWTEFWGRNSDNTCDQGLRPVTDTAGKPACLACLLGKSIIADNLIDANWAPAQLPKFHQTSLTHEYCHYFMLWSTGAPDDSHTGPCYRGAKWVDLVNADLDSAGL